MLHCRAAPAPMVSLLLLLIQDWQTSVAPAAQQPSASASASASATAPWVPPAADSPQLLPFLRDTSRPKLAYSTWVGWYCDGGLNETSLFAQVEAMADKLRPHGWTHILHDYGWQVCGTTYAVHEGCIHVDPYGRLYPSPERYPSTVPSPTPPLPPPRWQLGAVVSSVNTTCPAGFFPHEAGLWSNPWPCGLEGTAGCHQDTTNTTVELCGKKCRLTSGCLAFEVYQGAPVRACYLFLHEVQAPFLPNAAVITCTVKKLPPPAPPPPPPPPPRRGQTGSWKKFTDRAHTKGIAYGLHLMHGIPKLAVNDKLPVRECSPSPHPHKFFPCTVRLPQNCCCCCVRS
eukprot:SAG31_NODE_4404_length_3264_cov_2.812322_3_plen_343_part_00